jgi:hypothetical protein
LEQETIGWNVSLTIFSMKNYKFKLEFKASIFSNLTVLLNRNVEPVGYTDIKYSCFNWTYVERLSILNERSLTVHI